MRSMARLLTTALFAAALLIAGCGPPPGSNAPDGTVISQDGVFYAVQTSRELNPDDAADRVFLGGDAAVANLDRTGVTLVGVFLQVRNGASGARLPDAAPQLVDAFGKAYKPMRLPAGDSFAYRVRRLAPGDEIPGSKSVARESPESGALVVYRLPTAEFLTNRPFTMRFGADDRAGSVQLDL
jgi:hypothetical protein